MPAEWRIANIKPKTFAILLAYKLLRLASEADTRGGRVLYRDPATAKLYVMARAK